MRLVKSDRDLDLRSSQHAAPRAYRPNARKLTQLALSGLVATAATVVLNYLLPLVGIPGLDFAALYGSILNGDAIPAPPSGSWWLGMFCHFIAGAILFPIAYDYGIERRILPNRPWLKGLLWGGGLWALFEILIKPLAGEGLFSSRMLSPLSMVLVGLVSWLIYGVVLEAMTRVRIVHELRLKHQHAA